MECFQPRRDIDAAQSKYMAIRASNHGFRLRHANTSYIPSTISDTLSHVFLTVRMLPDSDHRIERKHARARVHACGIPEPRNKACARRERERAGVDGIEEWVAYIVARSMEEEFT